jgi:hypothetical protein
MSSVSFEHRVNRQARFSATYTVERGWNLLRLRNVNEPLAGIRPLLDRGPVLQYESTARLFRQQLVLGGTTRLSWLNLLGSYTLSSRLTDADSSRTIPANSYDLSTEYGPSSNDRRHRGIVTLSVTLPWKLQARSTLSASSGAPFNIRTGRDNNGDTLLADRPAFASPADPGAVVTPFGTFNPDPRSGDRIIPRNYGREGGQWEIDLSLVRGVEFRGPEGPKASLGLSINNLLNHVNFTGYRGVIGSPTFGIASRALAGRRVDLTAQFGF